MSTCRICKGYEGRMFKYAARHYAHGACGFKRFGAEFFDMIPAHMVPQLPYLAAVDAGLEHELERRCIAQAILTER